MATSIAHADVIVAGTYIGDSGFPHGARTGHLAVKRILKGRAELGVLQIDLTGSNVAVQPGEDVVMLLDRDGDTLRPANMPVFCGASSVYPAELRGRPLGRGTLAETIRGIGNFLVDEKAPSRARRAALYALCYAPAAARFLIAASSAANLKIRFGAMACRIAQGDIGLLGRLARKFAVAAPPPEAADLIYAILGIRDPDAVPALSAMARAKLPPLRTAAIEALGDTHSLAALPALRYALVHGDFVTRYAAARALPYILGGKAEVLTQDDFRAQEATIIKNWLARIAAAGAHGK